jgi:predicted transcriptional regulator
VRDIPRSHVVPVEAVMHVGPTALEIGGEVPVGTKVRDVVRLLAHADQGVAVIDAHGDRVGVIDRTHVLTVIAGEET